MKYISIVILREKRFGRCTTYSCRKNYYVEFHHFMKKKKKKIDADENYKTPEKLSKINGNTWVLQRHCSSKVGICHLRRYYACF